MTTSSRKLRQRANERSHPYYHEETTITPRDARCTRTRPRDPRSKIKGSSVGWFSGFKCRVRAAGRWSSMIRALVRRLVGLLTEPEEYEYPEPRSLGLVVVLLSLIGAVLVLLGIRPLGTVFLSVLAGSISYVAVAEWRARRAQQRGEK